VVSHDTRPCGGFIVTAAGNVTSAVDVDWERKCGFAYCNDRPTVPLTKNWGVWLKAGQNASGTAVPAITYEILPAPVGTPSDLTFQPTSELRRNGLRLAGGTVDLDVYNLSIRDRSYQDKTSKTAPVPGLSYEVFVLYQVRGRMSQGEYDKLGRYSATAPLNPNGKRTWIPGLVRIRAEARRFTSNQRAL